MNEIHEALLTHDERMLDRFIDGTRPRGDASCAARRSRAERLMDLACIRRADARGRFGALVRFDRVEKVPFGRPCRELGRNIRGRFVVERVGAGNWAG
jgi:hypothetical protein